MKKIFMLAVAAAVGLAANGAWAATVLVTPGNAAGLNWTNPAGENSGGGSAAITSAAPYDGNGSLELTGDRTRFVLGNIYSGPSLGLLSDVTSFGFSWMVDPNSTNSLNPDLTPALRLEIYDPTTSQRSELIWEGAYNGVYGNETQGTWYTTDAADGELWQYIGGIGGPTLNGSGAQINQDVSSWLSAYGSGAEVIGVSVGVGSSASSGYLAYADDVTIGFGSTSTTYNFEATAVPLPRAAGMGLGMLGLIGAAGLLRKKLRTA